MLEFSKLVFLFQVLSERDAQLLLKDEADLVLAVYDYWLAKRLRLVSTRVLIGDSHPSTLYMYTFETLEASLNNPQ